jgi:hypothetical protein
MDKAKQMERLDALWISIVGHPPDSEVERKLFAEGLMLLNYLPIHMVESWLRKRLNLKIEH